MTTGVLCTPPILQFTLDNGQLAAGGFILTQVGGVNAATYQDSGLTTPLPNPIPLNSRGEISDANGASRQLFLTPNIVYTFTLLDVAGNTIWQATYVNGIQVNAATIAAILYPESAEEVAAGATIVNPLYPYGYVDRYLTNALPGTTDMSPAFIMAAKVANQLGCNVSWGITAPYALNTAVNCTGLHGVVFNDESSGEASSSLFCSIIAGNNGGHTFDMSTSYECTFKNLAVKTAPGVVPLTLFFCARNVSGSGAGIHRFENIRTASASTFRVVGYQYGSEENTWLNCELYNSQSGSSILSWNSDNPQGWTSTFVTIATGAQSNVEHRAIACSFFNFGNSGSQNEVCIQLENASNVKCYGGLFACAHGLSYVSAVGTSAINFVTFQDMRGEVLGGGLQPQYGYVIGNSAGTTVQWTISNCQSDSVNELVHINSGTTVQCLNIRNGCSATSGKQLSAYNLSDSIIEATQSSTIVGQVGGSVTNNQFICARVNVTLSGTFSSNLYVDVLGGVYGIDSDSFTSASAACTGALTTSVQWTVRLAPNGKQIILSLPATLGTTTAAASFTYGATLPAAFRPTANLRQPVIIEDNGGTLNQLGQVFINSSTGAITVFKDIVGTGNFTNAVTGGLPNLTEVVWTL